MRMVAFRSSVCINDSDALRITTVTNYAHKNNILNYFSVANFTKKITLLFMHRASSNLLFSSTVDKYTHILLCLHSTSSCRCQCFLPLSAQSSAFPHKILDKCAYTDRNPQLVSFLSLQTSQLDCSTDSTTQNATSLCSPLSFQSLQTSQLDCSTDSTTQNATCLCSPLSFQSLKTSQLDCSTDSTTQNATSLCSPLSFLSLQTCSEDDTAHNASP